MVDNNDALIREVDEELRREQLAKLWERYGTYIIGAALAIVLGVAGYKWNEARQVNAAQSAGAAFEAASNLAAENKPAEAAKAFAELAKSGPIGYGLLSGLRGAGELAKAGKPAEAVAAYDAIAKSASDAMLRDFARLQAASLRLGTADFTEIKNRLNDLTGDSAPWRFSARELLGLAALKAGKLDEARASLEKLIGDPRVPSSLSQRAQVLMSEVVAAEFASGKTPAAITGTKGADAKPAGADAPTGTPAAAPSNAKK